jgi:membrane-bound lytic murein transglycosylase MltF
MASFADLPGEVIMLIARFRPHPCADIMQGLFNDDDEWCYWLERLAEMNDRLRHIAIEEEYARYCEHRAKRRRIRDYTDPLAMLRLEWEAEAEAYGFYD